MHRAFSLIELMIVIVIMGSVYMLAVNKFELIKEVTTEISMRNLKEYLQKIPHEKSVEILCLNNCSSCDLLVDGKKEADSIDDFIDASVEVYRWDLFSGVQEQSKKVFFNEDGVEKNVCFSFSVDKRGIGDQVLVKFKNKVYDYTTYLDETPVYASLQEFVDVKEKLAQEIAR